MSAAAGPVIAAVGSVVKGVGGFQAGKANAYAARAEARAATQEGVAQEADIRAQARRAAGEAVAAIGANGGGLGTGSALDLLRETALESGLDLLRVRRGAANKAMGLEAQAKNYRRQGAFDLVGGLLQAGATAADAAGGGGG